MELRYYQQLAINAVYRYLATRTGNPCIVIPTAGGKCLGKGTPILMFDGTVKPVEQVSVGDLLMGPDSRPRRVLSLGRGREMLYRVTPVKGESYVVNESHILSLKLTPDGKDGLVPHCVMNVAVRDYLSRSKTFRHRAKGYRVAVKFSSQSVTVDPYFLGLWLADGTNDGTGISKPDEEVLATVTEYAARLGLHVRTKLKNSCPTHIITSGRRGRRIGRNSLLNQLRDLNVIGNKHVPHHYLVNSREVRLQVLAGLLDGDGSMTKGGYDFSSTTEALVDAVIYLSRSLGLAAYKNSRDTKCQNGVWCHSFRCHVSGQCQIIPCKIARKKATPRIDKKDVTVYGISVKPIGVGDYYGFEIDGDKLFLLGDFTVTHNTPILATICRDAVVKWDSRVLVVTHVKELLEQQAETLTRICPDLRVGVYSAGLKRRDTQAPVIVAGVQSVFDKAQLIGPVQLLIVDEAHLISENSEGRYRTLIGDMIELNPDLRVIGLTATPYRTGSGWICRKDGILNDVCYEIGVKTLIDQGFLCPIVGKVAKAQIDSEKLDVVRGEFDQKQTEDAFMLDDVVERAVAEILDKTVDRKSVLIFCQGVDHARYVARVIRVNNHECKEVYGDTHTDTRAKTIADFKEGKFKYLVNVNVLTTGFDAPNIDCVCILRATTSPGLFSQMVGRGFRIHPAKLNGCLLLDFGGNLKRHGPIDAIRPKEKVKGEGGDNGKICPECGTVVEPGTEECPECSHVFEVKEREITHDPVATDEEPLSTPDKVETREVLTVTYAVHVKKLAPPEHPRTMRVSYKLSISEWISEWVCIEHQGFARHKAEKWWKKRSDTDCPTTAEDAVFAAQTGILEPVFISIKTSSKSDFPEIVEAIFGSAKLANKPETNVDDAADWGTCDACLRFVLFDSGYCTFCNGPRNHLQTPDDHLPKEYKFDDGVAPDWDTNDSDIPF